MISERLRPNYFPILVLSFVVLGFLVFVSMGNNNFSYLINGAHHPALDTFAKYVTHLGDGIFAALLSLAWLFFRDRKQGFYLLLSYAISALVAQFLKHLVFYDMSRPINHLDPALIHFVEGVTVHYNNSFPSGHATTIFALCTGLSFLMHKNWQIAFFFVAVVTALTRVYLLQHFLTDILFGAIIGSTTSIIMTTLFNHDK